MKNYWIEREKLYQVKEEVETIQKMQRCYLKVDWNLIKSQIKPSKILVKTECKVHNLFVIFNVVLNTIQTLCLRVGSTKETLDRFNQFKYFNTYIDRQTRFWKYSFWAELLSSPGGGGAGPGRGQGEAKGCPDAAGE